LAGRALEEGVYDLVANMSSFAICSS
jgi:hypothetical protein